MIDIDVNFPCQIRNKEMRKLRKVLPVVTMSARGAETAQLGIQFY
jgi:hypothetical protein